jgi:tetratricopeptide (TPR) repeat protein
MIHVDDPFNLKLRPSIWEIERILDYGPVDAEGWKIKGNVLVERGRLEEAADAYGMGIDYAGGNQRLKGKLHRKRAATFVAMGKYQRARREAIQSLAIQATDKTRLLLARILVRLRSYSAALEFLQQIGDRDENEVETLIGQLSTCVTEQRDGSYDLVAITEEAKRDDRVLHADYVSPIVELREEGVAGRGLFANEDIADGTLLIASKAVLCVFSHEMAKESGNLGDAPRTFDSVRATLAERLTQVIENGNARRVLGLTGGLYSNSSKLDLRKDDVFDYDDMQFDVSEVKDIIAKNSFALSSQKNTPAPPADENPLGNVGGARGGALFYVPAFLNHSCVPNASYFTIGDMMFVKTNRDVERGEELTVHYLFVERLAERDRNETMEKVWEFTCQCELCEYERENEETCLAADTIVSDALELAEVSKSDDAISELHSARKKLYELYKTPLPPVYAFTMLQSPPANPPASLARHLVVVQKELKRLARDTSPDESLNAAVNGAYHFLLKAYPHFGRIGSVGEAALRVWEYFVNNSEDSEPETAEAWLTEAMETHDKQLGAGFFEYQYGKFVSAVES